MEHKWASYLAANPEISAADLLAAVTAENPNRAAFGLHNPNLTKEQYDTAFIHWMAAAQYNFFVHSSLMTARPLYCSDQQLIALQQRFGHHQTMQEELSGVLKNRSSEVQQLLSRPYLPPEDTRNRQGARKWSISEALAYTCFTGHRFPPA